MGGGGGVGGAASAAAGHGGAGRRCGGEAGAEPASLCGLARAVFVPAPSGEPCRAPVGRQFVGAGQGSVCRGGGGGGRPLPGEGPRGGPPSAARENSE